MFDRSSPFRPRSPVALALLVCLAFAAGVVAAPETASAQAEESKPAKKKKKKRKRARKQEQAPVDYEVANYYVSTWPNSHFVRSLIAALATEDGRYGLRNNKLSIHRTNGDSEQRVLTSAAEISAALRDLFGIVVPDEPAFAAALARLDWPEFAAG